MHDAAHAYVAAQIGALGPFWSVLEVGSRNINGGVRDLFAGAVFEGTDIEAGDGVDYVCDATIALPSGPYDCVVCCEVFEHVEAWPQIVANAHAVLMPDGFLLLTMAGPGRAPHSAVDGGHVRDHEYYGNVDPDSLHGVLTAAGFELVAIDVAGPDVRATARKPD